MGSGITRLLSPNQGSDLLHGLKISYHHIFRIIRFLSIEFPGRGTTPILASACGSSCHTKSWLFDANMVSYSLIFINC